MLYGLSVIQDIKNNIERSLGFIESHDLTCLSLVPVPMILTETRQSGYDPMLFIVYNFVYVRRVSCAKYS